MAELREVQGELICCCQICPARVATELGCPQNPLNFYAIRPAMGAVIGTISGDVGGASAEKSSGSTASNACNMARHTAPSQTTCSILS